MATLAPPGYAYAVVQALESCAGWNLVSAPAPHSQNLNPPGPAPAEVWEILPAPAPQTIPTRARLALFRSQTRTCPKTTKNA